MTLALEPSKHDSYGFVCARRRSPDVGICNTYSINPIGQPLLPWRVHTQRPASARMYGDPESSLPHLLFTSVINYKPAIPFIHTYIHRASYVRRRKDRKERKKGYAERPNQPSQRLMVPDAPHKYIR